jgi:hypothetical protein
LKDPIFTAEFDRGDAGFVTFPPGRLTGFVELNAAPLLCLRRNKSGFLH